MFTTTVQSNFNSADRFWFKMGAVSFIVGIALLIAVNILHPHQANPSDNPAIFAEYAADARWLSTHLMQLFGTMFFMVPSFLAVYRSLENESSVVKNWARLALAMSVLTFAVYTVDMAIDGIALKKAVDKWAATTGSEQAVYFGVAEGIRWLENGVLGIAGAFQGLVVLFASLGMTQSSLYSKWLGWLGTIGGLGFFLGGMILITAGFSAAALIGQFGFLAILVWVIAVTIRLWRL